MYEHTLQAKYSIINKFLRGAREVLRACVRAIQDSGVPFAYRRNAQNNSYGHTPALTDKKLLRVSQAGSETGLIKKKQAGSRRRYLS